MATGTLKKIPGFSQGVRTNSSLRMMKLAAPVCPNSRRVRQSDGTFAEVGQNCQLAGGKWWEYCEEQGHDPYFRTHVWYETVDDWDEETGEMRGSKRIRHQDRYPNVVQVAVNRRINNGRGVVDSMTKKGRKRLADIGYEEVCQYRNCQKPIAVKSKAFGGYCSTEHLALVGADDQEMALPQIEGVATTFLVGGGNKAAQDRRRMLREAVSFAEVED